MIEDSNKNKFGLFLNERIEENKLNEYEMKIRYHRDSHDPIKIDGENSFLFSLKSNKRIDHMEKFEALNNGKEVFTFYNMDDENIFSFGNDILIKKYNQKNLCLFNNNKSFNYKKYGSKSINNCNVGERFIIENIQIIEME